MNQLGIALAYVAVQVSLLILPVIAIHLFATRRGPASGAWVASLGLILIVGLSAASFVPLRIVFKSERSLSSRPATASLSGGSTAASLPTALTPGASEVQAGSLELVRSFWRRFERRAAAPASLVGAWAPSFAIVSLAATFVGLMRLLLGLWALRVCRTRGLVVLDPALNALLQELRAAMCCVCPVTLHEVHDLASPATAGWRRPLILLPGDWRGWDDAQRRAVLAHELAHICGGDYVTSLVARLALVLHVYHPLVHWLAARLQLQQELAADALGARFAGGAEGYLQSLSQLALRQDGRIPSWPSRAFLTAPPSLIRRISMLRDETLPEERVWSTPRRVWTTLLLVAIAALASSLRTPALAEEAPETKSIVKNPTKRADAFDLSYTHDNSPGLLAFRPAAAFHREGLGHYATFLNVGMGPFLKQTLKLSWDEANAPPKVEEVEQISVDIQVRVVKGQKEYNRAFTTSGLMIRTVAPFDWKQRIQAWWPALTEHRDSGQVYYRFIFPGFGEADCFFIPDDRTLVNDDEAAILRLIRRKAPAAPAYAQGAEWSRVENGLLAIALDNRKQQWDEIVKGSSLGRAGLLPLVEHADGWFFGVADSDALDIRALASTSTAQATETTAIAVEEHLKMGRELLARPQPNSNAEEKAKANVFRPLLESFKVSREDGVVVLRGGRFGKLADFVTQYVGAVSE